jgi:hypothetical protein
LILLICGIVGIQVDQDFMDLPERIGSPVVLAMLGLLRADNLLASPWDDWTEVPPDSGSVSSGRRWLPNYEAVLRGWTTNQDIIREITADAFFAPLLQQRVTFLNTADFLSSIDAAPEPGPFATVAGQTLRRIRPRRSSVVASYV